MDILQNRLANFVGYRVSSMCMLRGEQALVAMAEAEAETRSRGEEKIHPPTEKTTMFAYRRAGI